MKQKTIQPMLRGLLFLVVLVLLSIPAYAAEGPEPFSCHITDTHGQIINGYPSETDGLWYLFVPSTEEIASLDLHVQGDITQVSTGTLSAEGDLIANAFADSKTLSLTCNGEAVQVIIKQSSLPSLHIVLADATLGEVHQDKDTKYKNNSVYLSDPAGEYDLTVEGSVEMKGRGNSTWKLFEKKGYQIKFDSKTAVMGMGKAKKWVLLANASDDSMMRTQLTYQMAAQMDMAFVPSFEYIDLWINGDYRGTYIIGEKVEPGDTRLSLANDAGALFEHDQDFYLEEDYWLYSKVLDRFFTMKEIVEEEDAIIQSAMADFEAAVDDLTTYLYSTPSWEVTLDDLSKMIDVDSFVKYYLVNEYTLNRESFSTSFYWYKDGPDDVIHLGPVWDFDTCMGNDGEPYTGSYGENHMLFHYLLAVPEFRQRTYELLWAYRDEFDGMTTQVDVLEAQIAASAEMNYLRWDVLGKPNPKGGKDFYPTFEQAVDALQSWLQGRGSSFAIPQCCAVASTVSNDCYEMSLCVRDGKEHDSVVFSVWSKVNGKDDVRWYPAKQDSDGIWRVNIDLGNHNSAGIYYISAYTDDQQVLVGSGKSYVETARAPRYPINMELSGERMLDITLTDINEAAAIVRFAVWGITTGQETTLQWYDPAEISAGVWKTSIPLCGFEVDAAETFAVHAYGNVDGTDIFLNDSSLKVSSAVNHNFADGRTCADCGFVNPSAPPVEGLPMYRLYNPNTGEHFYTGSGAERITLELHGWKYEGVGFHVPATSAVPVYRLYHPVFGDHMYTADEIEKNSFEAEGWNYEGIAFYSAADTEAPLYRLHNPNATAGAWHFTGSTEERDMLKDAGWIYEGIAWYSLRQDQVHNHVWSDAWQSNEIYHWHECTTEGCLTTENSEKNGYGEHTYANEVDITCDTCGYVRQVSASMFRMYNPNSGQHFYTGSEEERGNLVSLGWVYEGIGFNAPIVSATPVYRLYSPVRLSHIYTADAAEKNRLMNEGWNYEGIAFYSVGEDGAAQHRLYNPNAVAGAWHYTNSAEECDMLVDAGWIYEGIAWYSLWN